MTAESPPCNAADAGNLCFSRSAVQVTEQVTEQVRRLLVALAGKELGTRELMVSLQLGHRPTFLYDYLQPSLSGQVG